MLKKWLCVDFHSDSRGNDLGRIPISQNTVKIAQLTDGMLINGCTAGAIS